MNLHKHHPSINPHARKWAVRPIPHPAGPRKGDLYFVQSDMRYMGAVYTIRKINGRSFYYYRFETCKNPGVVFRRLLVEWEQWIDELFDQGFVFCNGTALLPPPRLTPAVPVDTGLDQNRKQAELAMADARRILAEHPIGDPVRVGDESRFTVDCGDGLDVTVTVPDDVSLPVACSCRKRVESVDGSVPSDSSGGHADPVCPCTHAFAVLIGRGEMTHRLLSFLL
ncbi:MAG TPA: hypothetical protein PKH54_06540 [Myxococcota bacterium]|nr:hypothetical protein [Myxococcota bacterium]HPB51070.1 hypothetical protein [Myxococcota bacterium]HQP96645.1 hypothetical protein [Myxococcota bacterium]